MGDQNHPLVFEADAPPVTVYVRAPDGVLIDVIQDVDLGDRRTSAERGRISLHAACLLAAIATDLYRERTGRKNGGLIRIPPPKRGPEASGDQHRRRS